MEPSLEQLRKNYDQFDDKKLIRIATEEAAGLRPEALELVKQIIKERGLSTAVTKGIDVQLEKIGDARLHEYTELLRRLPCPVCNRTDEKLNASITATAISYIFLTQLRKELKIACPQCLDKLHKDATTKSALFGWWGIPWGIIRTPGAIIFNNKMKKGNSLNEANNLLKSFVLDRVGRIESSRNNQEELLDIITHIR